jgi:hypothetical protein
MPITDHLEFLMGEEPYEVEMARLESRLDTLIWLLDYPHSTVYDNPRSWRHPGTGELLTLTEFLEAAIEDATQSIVYLRGG